MHLEMWKFEGEITLLTQKQDNIFILERLSGVIRVELARQKCLPLKKNKKKNEQKKS